jgi:hypothetical protein
VRDRGRRDQQLMRGQRLGVERDLRPRREPPDGKAMRTDGPVRDDRVPQRRIDLPEYRSGGSARSRTVWLDSNARRYWG